MLVYLSDNNPKLFLHLLRDKLLKNNNIIIKTVLNISFYFCGLFDKFGLRDCC